MKFPALSWLWVATSAVLFLASPSVEAVRGSSANDGGFLQELQRSRLRQLKSDSGDGTGNGVDGTAPLLDNQCYICTPDNKIRPTSIRVQYFGGVGAISRYQDDSKATCRDQTYPDSGPITTSYGLTYTVATGDIFTFTSDDGGDMDANTVFTFSNGITCSIHTSCSQPLVAGDQLGPFLLLEANGCVYSYCGDGNLDDGEECDEGEANMPSATCKNCTIPICGDGVVDSERFEVCDEGAAMPTATCRDCVIPACGDGVKDVNEACDEGPSMPTATCRNCTIPFCGDGVQDVNEVCDEGPGMPTATCRNCTIPVCGDGVQDIGESCDDGANGIDTDGCRDDCTIPRCGDGIVDSEEECDDGKNGDDSDGCRDNCSVPKCGDFIVDTFLGEQCDDGKNGDDTDGCRDDCTKPDCGDGRLDPGEECDSTEGCRIDCTLPFCGDFVFDPDLGEECDEGDLMPTANCRNCTLVECGDGILDIGEECDEGANNGNLINGGCTADCKTCVCEAVPTYDASSGALTIEFDMCGQDPLKSDFVGIYPCDAVTRVADQVWWNDTVCRQFPASCAVPFDYGYEEGETYVNEPYVWFSWTCGSPEDGGCQTNKTNQWPSSGSVTLDPNLPGANWAFLGGRSLKPGCYKVILQREMKFISAPPYPSICGPWGDAIEFIVPDPNTTTAVSPLETAERGDYSHASTSLTILSTFFVSMVSILALYFVNM